MKRLGLWGGVALAIGVPVVLAAFSPQLAWRSPVYIIAGFAGIFAMALLLVQPLLASGLLPGLIGPRARKAHRAIGMLLVALVLLHVAALWQTSPPDMIDALLLRSPTPFSIWGVIAMLCVFASASLVGLRRRIPLRFWRWGHRFFAVLIVTSSILHAVLIEGTMETTSKFILCAMVSLATLWAISRRRMWLPKSPKL